MLAAQQNRETLDSVKGTPLEHRIVLAIVGVCAWYCAPMNAQEVVVRSANGAPLWGESPDVSEELRIGSLLGADEYSFGSIDDVIVNSDGTVWVGVSQLHAIRRYTAEGAYIGQVGREGEGPGEFKYVSNMRPLSDGSVIVWDAGLLRVSRFTADGEFIASFLPPTHMIGGNFEELEVDQEDRIYLIAITALGPVERTRTERLSAASRQTRRRFWLQMSLDGDVLDSIYAEPSDPVGASDPILTQTLISPLGYRIVARNDRYSVSLEVSSELRVEIRRDIETVEYTRRERAEARRMEEVMNGRNGRPVRDIPSRKLPFKMVYADSQGRLWVQLRTPGHIEAETEGERATREKACEFFGAPQAECEAGVSEWREPLTFDVIGPDGRYFGRVELPNRQSRFEHAANDLVWVTEKGEYGEQYVVRYRIAPRDGR